MPRKSLPKICFDRLLADDQIILAARQAVEENPANIPLSTAPADGFGSIEPLELALETRTLWKPGRELRVRFLDGDPVVQAKVAEVAHRWEEYANIRFVFGDDPQAEIRIAFTPGAGSWSYLGTDALGISPRQTHHELWLVEAQYPKRRVQPCGAARIWSCFGLHPRTPEPGCCNPLEQAGSLPVLCRSTQQLVSAPGGCQFIPNLQQRAHPVLAV